VVTKISGKIIIDKRDGSHVDFLSVNETAQEPPNADDKDSMNSPIKLGQEASCINQNFSQMVLDGDVEPESMDQPNPFDEDEDGSVASGAYRYRKFTMPGNPKSENEFEKQPIVMVVRTEVSCKMPGAKNSYAAVRCLNEYDPKPNYSWRLHLESQRGACLATELKNNAYKLGRWTAQAILAGCDTMKIGYVSRSHPTDPWSHTVLGTQTYVTDGFADQIGLSRNNMFGIIRNIVDLVMGWDDGKYLLLKDPTKSVMRIYELPWDAFADEEGDEDIEEEEVPDLDEDGNVPPSQPVGPTVPSSHRSS
jgi:translation initiation factor 3 subunit D